MTLKTDLCLLRVLMVWFVCVLQKVNDIQDSYNKAADLNRQSGEGILDEDEAKTFHDEKQLTLVSICKHWDILDPVFHNRASAKPIAPTGTFNSAKPFTISAPRSSAGDEGIERDQPDFDFPFGEDACPKSDEEEAKPVSWARNISATSSGERSRGAEAAPNSARETICISTDTSSEETGVVTSRPTTSQRSTATSGATSATSKSTGNGKKAGTSTRGMPLTLKPVPQRKRKSLDDMMYDSICERTSIAKKRSCIEIAESKVKFTKDLLELGIYSTDEVKAMVAAQFEEN
ncbi:hypothetical protein JG688_00017432 [Phytophthora aleatoria]|uniref:Uncharacterized protein n=1 Tax=Phytophthora aleatoria TaxID=2496075 RepID=A0A8J5MC65_9STRA|nr:hypothetical protein JG688_00017432 [Phytophthora aleatoria]